MANALRDNQTRALGFSNAPVFDRRDLGTVGRGTADSYLSSIMAAPEWLLSKMLRDDPYQKGVLQSGPQDRMKAEQRRWEEYQADQAKNRDYAQGQDYGTGLGLVADPFIDALGAIPAVGKALKLKAPARSSKPFNALADLASERGAIDAQRVITPKYDAEWRNSIKEALPSVTDKTDTYLTQLSKPPRKPKRIYRGVNEDDTGQGVASLGEGFYTTRDKSFARKFGDKVVDVDVDMAWPDNPLVLHNAAGGADGALKSWIMSVTDIPNMREVNRLYPDLGVFVRELGFDGVVIGDEIVKY